MSGRVVMLPLSNHSTLNLGKQSGISRFFGKFSKSYIKSISRFGNVKKQLGRSLRDLEPMVKN